MIEEKYLNFISSDVKRELGQNLTTYVEFILRMNSLNRNHSYSISMLKDDFGYSWETVKKGVLLIFLISNLAPKILLNSKEEIFSNNNKFPKDVFIIKKYAKWNRIVEIMYDPLNALLIKLYSLKCFKKDSALSIKDLSLSNKEEEVVFRAFKEKLLFLESPSLIYLSQKGTLQAAMKLRELGDYQLPINEFMRAYRKRTFRIKKVRDFYSQLIKVNISKAITRGFSDFFSTLTNLITYLASQKTPTRKKELFHYSFTDKKISRRRESEIIAEERIDNFLKGNVIKSQSQKKLRKKELTICQMK